jgi:transcriptional regulator with XRE-family HTH domain
MSDNPVDIGREFKEKRLSLNILLDKAAKDTKISRSYLSAIEANEFGVIPNEIVAKGFLQIYSDYLGLDSKHLLGEFKKKTKKHDPVPQAEALQQTRISNKAPYYKFTVTAVILLLLIIFLSWGVLALFRTEKSRSTATVPLGLSIKVEIIGKTWMRAYSDGRQVFEGMFFAGTTKNINAKKSITLKIGNASAVKILSDGKVLYGGGAPGQVVTKEFHK